MAAQKYMPENRRYACRSRPTMASNGHFSFTFQQYFSTIVDYFLHTNIPSKQADIHI